jgi:uncharacterized protein YjbI with pentapeptide repeats
MRKYNKRRLMRKSQRKLMARWCDEKGQDMRSQLIAALHEHKSLAGNTLANLVSKDDSLPHLDLRCIDLSGQSLDGVDLSRAKLQGANLARCSLKKAKLVEADLRDTLLRNTDLTEADLRGVRLGGAAMENTLLQGANLDGAHITNSTIVAGTTALPSAIHRSEASPWFADSFTNSRTRGEE